MKVNLTELLDDNGYTLSGRRTGSPIIRKKTFRERVAEVSKRDLQVAVSFATSFSSLVRALGIKGTMSGSTERALKEILDYYGIDHSHLVRKPRKTKLPPRRCDAGMLPEEVVQAFFMEKGQHNLSFWTVVRLINDHNLLPNQCSECGIAPKWNGLPLKLHIDHINGDNSDHRLDNLRRICPNCHSQTDTYGRKNYRHKPIECLISDKNV